MAGNFSVMIIIKLFRIITLSFITCFVLYSMPSELIERDVSILRWGECRKRAFPG